MKFKKSYLLIISLISILLCITAVSATDNMDNEVLSDNSGSDISTVNEITDNTNDNSKLSSGDTDKVSSKDTNKLGEEPSSTTPEKEKINTTIESKDVEAKYNDSVKLDVNVKDNTSKSINVKENELEVYKDTEKINFTYEKSVITLNQTLDAGKYLLNLKFLGNENYTASETLINVTIFANTIEAPKSVDVNNYTNKAVITINVKNYNDTSVTVNKDDLKLVFTYFNGTANKTVDITDFAFSNKTISFVAPVLNQSRVTIKFKDGDSSNMTKPVEVALNPYVYENVITAPSSVKVNNYTSNVTININIKDHAGNNVTVNKDDLKLVFTYFDGTANKTMDITDFAFSNGTINFITPSLNQAKVTINYKENDPSNNTKPVTVTLSQYYDVLVKVITPEAQYHVGKFQFQLINPHDNNPITNKSIGILYKSSSISFVNYFTSDKDGYVFLKVTDGIFSFSPLTVGKFNLTFQSHDDLVLEKEFTTELTVTKANINFIISDASEEVGNTIKYLIKATYDETGEAVSAAALQFNIKLSSGNVQRNLTTNSSGESYINLNLYPGEYPVTVSSIDNKFNANPVSKTVTVKQKQGVLVADNRVIQYNTGTTVIFTLKDKNTGKPVPNAVVNLKIYTGSKYKEYNFRTNSKGQVSLITPLAVGKHKVVISCIDTNYTASTITRYVTVKKVSAKFKASKVKTYYKSGKIFTIKLTTTKGKPIYSGKILIKIFIAKNKYYKLVGKSNIDGLVRFTIPYKPGTYKVVISDYDSGYTAKTINSQIKVTRASAKLSPSKYNDKAGKYFKVKVTKKNSKKTIKSLKLKVKVSNSAKKYSKTYTIKSNKKGYANLKVTQKPGKYKVVISSANKYYIAKTAKSTIKVKK